VCTSTQPDRAWLPMNWTLRLQQEQEQTCRPPSCNNGLVEGSASVVYVDVSRLRYFVLL